MKSLFKTVGVLLMAMGTQLAEAFWIGMGLVLFGGIVYFLADYDDYRCPCVCDEEEEEWID